MVARTRTGSHALVWQPISAGQVNKPFLSSMNVSPPDDEAPADHGNATVDGDFPLVNELLADSTFLDAYVPALTAMGLSDARSATQP